MIASVSENKKKSVDFHYCIACGCTTLIWREIWQTCANCNAVYGKRDLITEDKSIESFINDKIVPGALLDNKEKGKGFYFSNKALLLMIPLFFLGVCLCKTL